MPYPDELVGSILARGVIHTGLPPKRLLQRLFGTTRSGSSVYLPSDVAPFARRARVSATKLLWDHTVFPYSVAFMAAQQVSQLEAKALSGCSNGAASLSSLVKSVTHSTRTLRFCPQCAIDELQGRGESYWHRTHCLPNVHVCLRHGVELMSPRSPPRTLSQHLLLPLPHLQTGVAETTACPSNLKMPLAGAVDAVLSKDWRHKEEWQATYRARALGRQYALSAGLLAGARLSFDLRQLYSPMYLFELGADIGDVGKSWPALMVRERVRVPFAPTKHVLLDVFLRQACSERVMFAYQPPGKQPTDLGELDKRLSTMVMKEAERLLKARQTGTVQSLLEATGHWQMFRRKRHSLPLTVAQVERFKRTEASQRKTGGRKAHSRRLAAIAEGRQKPLPPWKGRKARTEEPTTQDRADSRQTR